jgi:hypothetical protein
MRNSLPPNSSHSKTKFSKPYLPCVSFQNRERFFPKPNPSSFFPKSKIPSNNRHQLFLFITTTPWPCDGQIYSFFFSSLLHLKPMASGKSNDEGPRQPPIGLVGLSRAGFVPKQDGKARSTAGLPIIGIAGRQARQPFLVDKATIEPVGQPTVNIGHVDLMRHVCPPPSVPGASNWASSVGKSTQSNFVGFSMFSGGDISFGSTFGYGVGGSGHGRSGGFFLEDGNGHRSACPADMSKLSSDIRPFLCLGYISIIFSSLYYSIDS